MEIRPLTPARVLFLPAERILDHCGDPDVVRVMANLLMEISAKFANLNRKNHLLTEPRLRNRLLICFNGLTPAPNGIRIMPFGQKELAQYLNVNRSALNRELSRMKEEGVIEMDGRAVRIFEGWGVTAFRVAPACGAACPAPGGAMWASPPTMFGRSAPIFAAGYMGSAKMKGHCTPYISHHQRQRRKRRDDSHLMPLANPYKRVVRTKTT